MRFAPRSALGRVHDRAARGPAGPRAPPARRTLTPQKISRTSRDFEQAGGAHAAADAHGDDDVTHLAPFALDERVPDHARAAHAVGVPDADGAAVHVQAIEGDAELVAA